MYEKCEIFTGQHVWASDRWTWRPGRKHEVEMTDFLLKHVTPDTVFMDAGAHIGCFAIGLSSYVAKVIAVEPREHERELLYQGIQSNELDNVEVCPQALWSTDGGYGQAGTKKRNTHALILPAEDGDYPLLTLDTLLNGAPLNLFKIDVEGAELHILQGAIETLKKFHPVIAIELHCRRLKDYFDQDPLEVFEFLWRLGYRLELLGGRHRAKVNAAERLRTQTRRLFIGAT